MADARVPITHISPAFDQKIRKPAKYIAEAAKGNKGLENVTWPGFWHILVKRRFDVKKLRLELTDKQFKGSEELRGPLGVFRI